MSLASKIRDSQTVVIKSTSHEYSVDQFLIPTFALFYLKSSRITIHCQLPLLSLLHVTVLSYSSDFSSVVTYSHFMNFHSFLIHSTKKLTLYFYLYLLLLKMVETPAGWLYKTTHSAYTHVYLCLYVSFLLCACVCFPSKETIFTVNFVKNISS